MADTRITAISTTYDRDTISLSTDYLIGDRSGGSSFRAQVDEIVLGVLENIAENVGIGTATPGALLEVESAASVTGIIINNTATDGDPYLAFALSGTNKFTMGVDDGDSDTFKIGTTTIGTNSRLVIDSSGQIGIGVKPDSFFNILQPGDASTDGINIERAGAFRGVIYLDATTDSMHLRRSNVSTQLILASSGNVGIGTTSPTATLQVNGSIAIVDGMTAPSTISGYAVIYVDSSDGDLKCKFGDGTVKTIVTDT